jgi:chemotaxis response regulator CheB
MPAMLTDMIEHLVATEQDLVVVGKLGDGERSLPAALAAEADVLVLQRGAVSGGADSALAELLTTRPLTVLVLAEDGKTGDLYRIAPQTIDLNTLTNAFARAVRIAARSKLQ